MAKVFLNDIYKQPRGTVVRVVGHGEEKPPVLIAIQDTDIGKDSAAQMGAIVTQTSVLEEENVQAQPSTADTTYIYSFGRKPGQLKVSGIGFSNMCSGPDVPGATKIIEMYEKLRFGYTGKPVNISIGPDYYQAFLVGLGIDYVDAETHLAQWVLRFFTFPGQDQPAKQDQADG